MYPGWYTRVYTPRRYTHHGTREAYLGIYPTHHVTRKAYLGIYTGYTHPGGYIPGIYTLLYTPGRLHTRHIHHYTHPGRLHTLHIPYYTHPGRLHTRHIPPYVHQGGYIPGIYRPVYTLGTREACWVLYLRLWYPGGMLGVILPSMIPGRHAGCIKDS